jgi:hypothetical protein
MRWLTPSKASSLKIAVTWNKRLAREEAERLAREEADRKAQEEAEREAQRKALEERVRKALEAERQAKAEADRRAKEKAEQLADAENISPIPPPVPIEVTLRLAKGRTLIDEIVSRGVTRDAAHALVASIEPVFPTQQFREGAEFETHPLSAVLWHPGAAGAYHPLSAAGLPWPLCDLPGAAHLQAEANREHPRRSRWRRPLHPSDRR